MSTGIDSQMLYADSCFTGGGKGCWFPSKGEQEKVDNQCSEWVSQPRRILTHTRGRRECENKLALIAIIKWRNLTRISVLSKLLQVFALHLNHGEAGEKPKQFYDIFIAHFLCSLRLQLAWGVDKFRFSLVSRFLLTLLSLMANIHFCILRAV